MRPTAPILLAILLLGGALSPAEAQQLHGRVRQTWTRLGSDVDPETTDSMVQDYQLNFRNMVARDLSWQLRLRALLRGTDRDDAPTASDTALFEPFLQIVYDGPQWTASAGARMTRVTPKGDHSNARDQERRDYFGRVEWSDEVWNNQTMDVSWNFYRLEREDDAGDFTDRRTNDTRNLLQVGYRASSGGVTVGLENRNFDDVMTGFERDVVEITGSGDFRRHFPGSRLTVTGRALLSEQTRTEYTPDSLDILVSRDLRAGLFAVDNTPQMDPLNATPGLIDGDRNSVAADLDGRDRNYGVDLGFAKEVEVLYLYLERQLQAGSERDFSFEVYTSDDGDMWTQRADFAATDLIDCSDLLPPPPRNPPVSGWCYEPLQNRFEFKVPVLLNRYVKLFSTGFSSAEVPLGVTEMTVFGEETRTGQAEFDASRQSGNLALAWRPSRPWSVNLNFVGGRLRNGSRSSQETEEDFTSTLTAIHRSSRNVTTTGRLQSANRDSTTGRPERDRVASMTVAGSPVPDMDLSAAGIRRRNDGPEGLIAANDSLNLRSAFRLALHTTASLDVSFSHLDNRDLERIQNRRTGRVSLISTLRPGVLFTNDVTMARIEFESDEDFPARTDYDLRSRLSYRPTRVLGGSFEYLWQKIAGRQGTSRLFDLDWLPFPGGALQLQFTVVRDRLGYRGALRDEERVGMRWTLNPRTLVEGTYGVLRRGDETGDSSSRTVTAFLEFRF